MTTDSLIAGGFTMDVLYGQLESFHSTTQCQTVTAEDKLAMLLSNDFQLQPTQRVSKMSRTVIVTSAGDYIIE